MEATKKILKTNSIKIHLHLDNYTGKQGKNQIYLRVYYGKTLYIRTGKSHRSQVLGSEKEGGEECAGELRSGEINR